MSRPDADTRCTCEPAIFDGTDSEWSDWSRVTEAYLDTLSPGAADMLDQTESHPNPITPAELAASHEGHSHNRCTFVLTSLVRGHALLMLMKCRRGRGLECWRMKAAREVREPKDTSAEASPRAHCDYEIVQETRFDRPKCRQRHQMK